MCLNQAAIPKSRCRRRLRLSASIDKGPAPPRISDLQQSYQPGISKRQGTCACLRSSAKAAGPRFHLAHPWTMKPTPRIIRIRHGNPSTPSVAIQKFKHANSFSRDVGMLRITNHNRLGNAPTSRDRNRFLMRPERSQENYGVHGMKNSKRSVRPMGTNSSAAVAKEDGHRGVRSCSPR